MSCAAPDGSLTARTPCLLCTEAGGRAVWADSIWRVVGVDDADFPAFYRVISQEHVEEFSVLSRARRAECMEIVCAIEATLLKVEQPTSVNLASLGNMVPHLHWHVIARFNWDSHFPESVWGTRQRRVSPSAADCLLHSVTELDGVIAKALDSTEGIRPTGAVR